MGLIKAGKIKLNSSPLVSYHCSLQIFGSQKRGLLVPTIVLKYVVLTTSGALVMAARASNMLLSTDLLASDMVGFGLYTEGGWIS